MTAFRRLALPLAVLAWVAFAVAMLVAVVGPIAVPPLALSISSPSRLVVLALASAAAAVWLRGGVGVLLDDLARDRAPYAATFALVIASLLAAQYSLGAISVGGADSAGYLAQARRWQTGRLHEPLPLTIPGLADPWVQSPLGTRPDASGTATVPTYPPGLPWLQAAALGLAGEAVAIRALPAVAGAIALGALWLIAVPRTGRPGAAVAVACVAALPPFLYQALQPMSDVPALAAWLLAMALAGRVSTIARIGAVVATVAAVLVRPNLAPLVLAVAWQASVTGKRLVSALPILAGAALGVASVAAVQAYLYGSPWQSGYGRASELFALSYIPVNFTVYAAWLREGIAWPSLVALVIGIVWLVARAIGQQTWRPLALMTVLTALLYAVYIPFDSWTYLRFVLVALALAPVGAAHLLGLLESSRHARWTFPVTAALVLSVTLPNLHLARELGVFGVRAREYRYQAAGTFVRDDLPTNAVIVATQHSASAPYYSGRPVIRPDLVSPDGWRSVIAWAARDRRPLVFVLDEAEPAMLRQRFGEDGIAALDWPPRAEVGRPVATRVWVDGDRDTYLAGGGVKTMRLTEIPR